jgi:hypothetical protein
MKRPCHITRPCTWTPEAERVLAIVYPHFPAPLVAKGLGKSPGAVRQMASAIGVRKTARGRSGAAKWAQNKRQHLGCIPAYMRIDM